MSLTTYVLIVHPGASGPFEPSPPARPWITAAAFAAWVPTAIQVVRLFASADR